MAKVKAKLLAMLLQSDLLVYPIYSQEAAEHLKKLGKTVQYHEIPGDGGRDDSVDDIDTVGDQIIEIGVVGSLSLLSRRK